MIKPSDTGYSDHVTAHTMTMQKLAVLGLLLGVLTTSACAPLIVGGAVVLADEALEQDQGGDGLF